MKNRIEKRPNQEKVDEILRDPPEVAFTEAKRKEFYARLYNISDERKHIVGFPELAKSFYSRTFVSVAALVTLVIAFNFLFSPIYPVVSNIKGTVKIYRASRNEWIFADRGNLKLAKNDILKTFSDGQADLVIKGLYHIRLKSDSEIKLAKSISRAMSGDIDYALTQGKVFTHYNKYRKTGKSLSIDTPQAEASALGTDFMVSSIPMMDRTVVGVLDGIVKVGSLGISKEAGANIVMVKAGERTVVQQGLSPQKPARLMENELLDMEELYSIGTRPQVALLISTGSARTRELLSVVPLYISGDEAGALPDKIEQIAKKFNQSIKEGSREKHIDNIKQFEELISTYPNPKYDVQFLLFIGAYYDYIDEYARAVATFERVLRDYPNSTMASIAQCAIGIIYEENLKDPNKAKTAYQKVMSNYSNSPEVEEASEGLSRLTR